MVPPVANFTRTQSDINTPGLKQAKSLPAAIQFMHGELYLIPSSDAGVFSADTIHAHLLLY